MRWKITIVALLIGSLLGFAAQFLGDLFFAHFLIRPDGTLEKSTVYEILKENQEKTVQQSLGIELMDRVWPLLLQGLFLEWLRKRSDQISATTIIGALLLAAATQTAASKSKVG